VLHEHEPRGIQPTAHFRREHLNGLSLFVLNKYAGGPEPETLGHAKLTTVFDKFTDIGNGIDRK
jgi:hypothetical protein